LIYDRHNLGNHYSQDVVFIQITLNAGRSIELKKAFFKRIVDDVIVQLKTRPDDVVINLVEVPKEIRIWDRAIRSVNLVANSAASTFPTWPVWLKMSVLGGKTYSHSRYRGNFANDPQRTFAWRSLPFNKGRIGTLGRK
jgi:hypothetical protein